VKLYQPPSYSAEVNEWSYTSARPRTFIVCTGTIYVCVSLIPMYCSSRLGQVGDSGELELISGTPTCSLCH
jgi:hypothetical protein